VAVTTLRSATTSAATTSVQHIALVAFDDETADHLRRALDLD
jgi:hypothetical protein